MVSLPGTQIERDFEYVMGLARSYDEPEEKFRDGLGKLESITQQISDEAKRLNLDQTELENDAQKLKDKNNGDILPALTYLSNFTHAFDPRDLGNKRDYLKGLLCWTLTAKEYLQRNMRIQAHLKLKN